MNKLTRYLVAILGKSAFATFGLVTFLVAALLATVNLSSRYALKVYVEDQLERTPWDVAVYSTGAVTLDDEFSNAVRSVDGVSQLESLVFLRAQMPAGDQILTEVDSQPMGTPWLCLLAATDTGLLPPVLHLALAHSRNNNDGKAGAVLALVGPERAMGRAFLGLQGAREFGLSVNVSGNRRSLFQTPLDGVIRIEREELNRWFMDQTGSITFVPAIGTILLTPYVADILKNFDSIASGLIPPEILQPGETYEHINVPDYIPEVMYLARVDRSRVISGWDIPGSLQRMANLRGRLQDVAQELNPRAFVDSTTLVLLDRMARIARLVGLISLLVALPLLWVGWVLAANLSGLLMINERRKLGLMRLRGVPGRLIGRALTFSITSGGFLGGLLGLAAGSVVPLLIYEKGGLPLDVLSERRQLLLFLLFFVVTLVLAELVSRRLIRYATTISPLEASGRVAGSEAARTRVRFGPLEFVSLVAGSYVLASWIGGFSAGALFPPPLGTNRYPVLDFIGLPLFLYGVTMLLASRPNLIRVVLRPIVEPIGGALGKLALKHISVKPHRTVGFLLIVALMASVSLYPTITSRSFEEKAVRGARVQIGSEWQFAFNAPDLSHASQLQGPLRGQLSALDAGVRQTVNALKRVAGVQSVSCIFEALLPNFYLPGYGLRGVPLYLIDDPDGYVANVYSEPQLGLSASFSSLMARLKSGNGLVSPPVADFWNVSAGTPLLLGIDGQRQPVAAPAGGALAFLPGMLPRTVTDRQGYVEARVDYLNYLFSGNAYIAWNAADPGISELQVLIPRVIMLVKMDGGIPVSAAERQLVRALPVQPLEVHNLTEEIRKVGSDMFISLALQNMRIYLFGGLFLAVVAIVSISMANYAEDRRTFALIRIRGTSLAKIWRFLVAMLLSPALLGLILGAAVALVAGYGLTNYVWKLREISTVVQLLPTHLVVSPLTFVVGFVFLVLLVGVTLLFSLWVFRKTARENIQEG